MKMFEKRRADPGIVENMAVHVCANCVPRRAHLRRRRRPQDGGGVRHGPPGAHRWPWRRPSASTDSGNPTVVASPEGEGQASGKSVARQVAVKAQRPKDFFVQVPDDHDLQDDLSPVVCGEGRAVPSVRGSVSRRGWIRHRLTTQVVESPTLPNRRCRVVHAPPRARRPTCPPASPGRGGIRSSTVRQCPPPPHRDRPAPRRRRPGGSRYSTSSASGARCRSRPSVR